MTEAKDKPKGLALMREPFPETKISKLPKPTTKQAEDVKSGKVRKIRCTVCSGWHHPGAVHLDYVGHAAITDRLLECDPTWNWEPVAFDEQGMPAVDRNGGMWIRLTVCGQTRLGYGSADGKKGGDAVKELIGDALRNAAMRFGAALDLWHKGDLHQPDDEPIASQPETRHQAPHEQQDKPQPPKDNRPSLFENMRAALAGASDFHQLEAIWTDPRFIADLDNGLLAADKEKIKQIYSDQAAKVQA